MTAHGNIPPEQAHTEMSSMQHCTPHVSVDVTKAMQDCCDVANDYLCDVMDPLAIHFLKGYQYGLS